MATKPPTPEPISDDAPAAAEHTAAPLQPAPDTTPAAGGCYTRDPATGALTLVTPSTLQE